MKKYKVTFYTDKGRCSMSCFENATEAIIWMTHSVCTRKTITHFKVELVQFPGEVVLKASKMLPISRFKEPFNLK